MITNFLQRGGPRNYGLSALPGSSGFCARTPRFDGSRTSHGVVMASVLYQNYLIVASSRRIETTGKWGIWVGVYWSSNGRRLYQIFNRLTDTFDNKDAAEE